MMPMIDATPTDDAALLRRYADACDEAAFAELVRRYLGLVYHAAFRQMGGEAHTADDVTQRVFTLLARKAPTLHGHTTLAGWLHTTTRFTASEVIRTERRRRAREQEAFIMDGNPIVSSALDSDSAWSDLRPVIDEALGELDAPDREAVLLRYFAGLPHAQIGARLAISENAARMRVERALEKLHARLARRGVTSTAAALGVVLANQAGAATAAVPVGMAASVTSAALAGSATAGVAVSAAGIFGFMSTAKIVVGLAVVVGVAGLGSAFYERNHATQAEATLVALQREAEELRAQARQNEARVRQADERAQVSEARAIAMQNEVANARVAAAANTTARPVGAATPTVRLYDENLNNPEYFRLTLQKFRAELGSQYALLYRTLGLSTDQIAKFEENLTKMRKAELELIAGASSQGVSPADSALAPLVQQMMSDTFTELRELLGPSGFQEYNGFRRALSAADIVGSLAARVYSTTEPLSGLQGEQLTRAIVAQTQTVPVAPGSKTMRNETDWMAVAGEAKRILSPSQMAALQALFDVKALQAKMISISAAPRTVAKPK